MNTKVNKRDIIIRTAQQLFSEKGYAATGVREIAEKSGVSTANFYNYFKNKDELFRNLIDPQNIINSLTELPRLIREDFPENFDRVILEIKRVVDMNSELYKLLFIDLIEFGGYNTNKITEQLIAYAHQIFDDDVKSRIVGTHIKDMDYNFHIKAFIISMVSIFLVNNILPSAKIETYDDKEIAEGIAKVLLEGIKV